jgi:hypothetical protein
MSSDEVKLQEAFRNPKYTWRTLRGISKETGISQQAIRRYVMTHGDEIIKSSSNNSQGEQLYAAREIYRSKGNPLRRFMSAVKNRGG